MQSPNVKNKLNIFICTHKDFVYTVHNDIYKIINAREIDANLPLKDAFYSELYHFKYIADNLELPEYVVFCHYRRYFQIWIIYSLNMTQYAQNH